MGEKREEMQWRQKTRKTIDIGVRTERRREKKKKRRCETRTSLLSRLKDAKEEGGGGSVWCMFCINGILFLPVK
jgi:hypothetical protein